VILFFFHLPFLQGDPVKLLEDVQALRPTIFPGVPRVWQRIYGANTFTRRCHSVCGAGTNAMEQFVSVLALCSPRLPDRAIFFVCSDRVHAQVASAGVVKSTLFNTAYKSKVGKLQRGELSADGKLESNWDRIVFNNLAALFGGRVKVRREGGSAALGPAAPQARILLFSAE